MEVGELAEAIGRRALEGLSSDGRELTEGASARLLKTLNHAALLGILRAGGRDTTGAEKMLAASRANLEAASLVGAADAVQDAALEIVVGAFGALFDQEDEEA